MSMTMKARRSIGTIAALALTAATLSGCVYYPSNRYAYGGGGYYAPAPAVVVAPAPIVVGGYWGGGWGGRRRWR
jgi:hypothetical protein